MQMLICHLFYYRRLRLANAPSYSAQFASASTSACPGVICAGQGPICGAMRHTKQGVQERAE
eukprot:scaffold57950_cov30-Tisochrysis_lutea.AAC.8